MLGRENLLRRVILAVGFFIMSIPLIYFLFGRDSYYGMAYFIFFLGLSLIACSIITLSRKIFYWCLHASIWMVCFSLGTLSQGPPIILLFPIGISLILAAFYKVIVGKGTNKNEPKPQEAHVFYQPYHTGYQPPSPQSASPTYEEGGQQYIYSQPGLEQAQVQSTQEGR
ncbi:MAG: hypothetical protein ACJ788_05225 [Ktedonobacteraceae bacterium]